MSVLLCLLLLSILLGVSNARGPSLSIGAPGMPSEVVAAGAGFGWGTAELIETDDARLDFGPQIAVDPRGNAVVVWMQDDGTRFNIWANRFVPGVGWGTAELIETDAGNALFPQVATDPQGNAIAVWSQGDGTRDNIWANRFAEEVVSPGLAISPLVIVTGIGAGVAAVAAVGALLILRSRGKRRGEG